VVNSEERNADPNDPKRKLPKKTKQVPPKRPYGGNRIKDPQRRKRGGGGRGEREKPFKTSERDNEPDQTLKPVPAVGREPQKEDGRIQGPGSGAYASKTLKAQYLNRATEKHGRTKEKASRNLRRNRAKKLHIVATEKHPLKTQRSPR